MSTGHIKQDSSYEKSISPTFISFLDFCTFTASYDASCKTMVMWPLMLPTRGWAGSETHLPTKSICLLNTHVWKHYFQNEKTASSSFPFLLFSPSPLHLASTATKHFQQIDNSGLEAWDIGCFKSCQYLFFFSRLPTAIYWSAKLLTNNGLTFLLWTPHRLV